MKKIIGLLIAISVVCGVFFFIQSEVGNDTEYYTKVTNQGTKEQVSNITIYNYKLRAANGKGDVKMIPFGVVKRKKPLRLNAYLRLQYNKKKGGVINWVEVAEKDVPAKALDQLK